MCHCAKIPGPLLPAYQDMLTALDSKMEKMHQRLVALDEHVSVSKRNWGKLLGGVRTIFYISIQHAGRNVDIHSPLARTLSVCTLQLRNTQFESANKNLSAMDKSSYTLGLDLPGDVSDPGDEFEVCRVLG